ncbi:MAG TPA: hydroxyacid dehydrogenase, partial [Acidimicrobiaceae bacterium]|nr:hydroxyacid dehydrogenase [Acidimicrobiaceae bacterium]
RRASGARVVSAAAPRVAVEPECWRRAQLAEAVRAGGGEVVAPEQAEALVWAEPERADLLPPVLDANPGIEWVQLPYAGIEPFVEMLAARPGVEWTCGKGVYAEPVAEHVVALALAGMRGVGAYAAATTWTPPQGRNLIGANVTLLGGGGIAESLLPMLAPFGCDITVLRRSAQPLAGAT